MKKLITVCGFAIMITSASLIVTQVKAQNEHEHYRGHSSVVIQFSDYPLGVMPVNGATGSGPDVPQISIGDPFVQIDAMLLDHGFTREYQGGLLYIYNHR